MENEELFGVFAEIDERYLNEATQINKQNSMVVITRKIAAMVAALVLVAGFIAIGQRIYSSSHFSMKVIASEIGKEHMQFGATVPRIINVTDCRVIMYDYIGVWVYDLEQQELVGFCDFRTIGMTQIQGYPCTLVEATNDGQYVKFYQTDGTIRYLYDVEKNSYKQVEVYDKTIEDVSSMNISDSKNLSEYSQTYVTDTGYYIAYRIDPKAEPNELRYKDLIIITEKDGVISEYRPFAENK